MVGFLLALQMVLGLPPDLSQAYFPDLSRPAVAKLQADRGDGPVILIVVDAMRPDRLPAYGFKRDTAPNLTKLADEGVVLTNYFVNGNWTRPSTTSLLTGLTPARHGVERDQDRLAEQFVTLAEMLHDTGVPTGAVVGNGNAASAFGLGQGFGYFADTVNHWDGLPSAEQVVELAVPFVELHKTEPFFLMLFFVDPHDPYHAPGEYENMFVEDHNTPLVRSPHWERETYSTDQQKRMMATYDGAVRYTDTVIGRFFDHLRSLDLYEKATIVVTSDHGEAFGEHGVYLHAHHLYDEIIRAPLIVRTPKMSKRGGYNHFLFQAIDLLPTVAGLYDVAPPAGLPGVDMLLNLREPRRNRRDRVVVSEFHNFGIDRQMIRTYTEKVVLEQPANEAEFMATVRERSLLPSVSFDQERVKLFDLKKDPFEKRDRFSPALAKKKRWRRLINALRVRDDKRPDRVGAVVENLDPALYEDLKALGYIQ